MFHRRLYSLSILITCYGFCNVVHMLAYFEIVVWGFNFIPFLSLADHEKRVSVASYRRVIMAENGAF